MNLARATITTGALGALLGASLTEREATGVAAIFALLGDPTRVRLLAALAGAPGGERCVGELARAAERDESTISHQLRLLRNHGLVESRRAGRVVYYRLADAHVLDLFRQALAHAAHSAPVSNDREAR
jgi:DNA-binding transcriptional ArsR family regulator